MKMYLASLGAGLLVGIVYNLLNVRSPAPPVVALIGLFGILVGEQIVPVGREIWSGHSVASAWGVARCASHMFGVLPSGNASAPAHAKSEESKA